MPLSKPVLRNFDFDLLFLVHIDDSETGLRAVQSAIFKGKVYPILYISRKLNAAKRRYTAIELNGLSKI